MDKNLKIYLENVIELEKNLYTQENTIARLNNRISRLCIKKKIEHEKVFRDYWLFDDVLKVGIISVPAGAIILGLKSCKTQFISGLFRGALIGAALGFAIALIYAIICNIKQRIEDNKRQAEYDADYKKRKSTDEKRLELETIEKNNLIKIRDQLKIQTEKTRNTLRTYYNVGVLHRDYWDMCAVCSIYQYLESERCYELTGPFGAYNKYQEELRQGIIISKLTNIENQLYRIEANQQKLFEVYQESNRKIDSLISISKQQAQMQSLILENTEVVKYNAIEAKNELNYLGWLKTYELMNK